MTYAAPASEILIDGFGPLNPGDLTINAQGLPSLIPTEALNDTLVERTISGASTVTLQLTDPSREILNSGIFTTGDQLELDDLSFTLVQFNKAADQLQLTFEASGVAELRLQTGNTVTTTTSDVTSFAAFLVSQVPGLKFVGDPTPVNPAIAVGRGTSTDPTDDPEDSWTCLQRLATTAGLRCWESAGTIYFGSDPFWESFGVKGTLQEWTAGVQNMDFDFDVGKPYGDITVTAMTQLWAYNPGDIVHTSNLGPASSYQADPDPNVAFTPNLWIVSDMQRDMFSPQATITLTVPMPPYDLINVGAGAAALQNI